LIERGADVDSRDRLGRTPLLVAADHKQLEVVRLLLDNGADVNAQMRNGDTALHLSSYNMKVDVTQLLLERGANFNALDADGKTPRQVARRRGNRKVAEFLLGFEEHGHVTI
jgi:ankyrin repeat protein